MTYPFHNGTVDMYRMSRLVGPAPFCPAPNWSLQGVRTSLWLGFALIMSRCIHILSLGGLLPHKFSPLALCPRYRGGLLARGEAGCSPLQLDGLGRCGI